MGLIRRPKQSSASTPKVTCHHQLSLSINFNESSCLWLGLGLQSVHDAINTIFNVTFLKLLMHEIQLSIIVAMFSIVNFEIKVKFF